MKLMLLFLGLGAVTGVFVRGGPIAGNRLPAVPSPLIVRRLAAPSDSLVYTLKWGRSKRATGYLVTVTAAPGTWTNLPTGTAVTDTMITFVAVNETVDSVRFTAAVAATNRFGISATTVASWSRVRRPAPPGPITVDSSLLVVRLDLKPDSVTVAMGDSVQFCAFPIFGDGRVALRAIQVSECTTLYASTFPVAQRAVTPAQQQAADRVCLMWVAAGGTWGNGQIIEQEACAVGARRWRIELARR